MHEDIGGISIDNDIENNYYLHYYVVILLLLILLLLARHKPLWISGSSIVRHYFSGVVVSLFAHTYS